MAGEVEHEGGPAGRGGVDGDALLAGVEIEEEAAAVGVAFGVLGVGAVTARAVAGGRLDLDDLRAVEGEEPPQVGRGDVLAELDDAQPFQRAGSLGGLRLLGWRPIGPRLGHGAASPA